MSTHTHAAPLTLSLLALLAAPAGAQEQPEAPGPAEVERVYVPSKGFRKVIRRHPRGVLVTEAELRRLLALAGRRPAPNSRGPQAPLAATIQRLNVSGKVEQGVATLTADAEVSVLAPGQVGLPLPLSGIGLRGVWVGKQPARVVVTQRGPEVLLPGNTDDAPTTHRVTWELALSVQPGEGRGSGSITVPVPACASGRLRLDLPGDLEVRTDAGAAVWVASQAKERTVAQGAFGGAVAGAQQVRLAWRPRRALERVRPYTIAAAQSRFDVQRGVVGLTSEVRLQVFRAARGAFALDLPPGFVVTQLTLRQGAVTHVQRGDRVLVQLDTPRRGLLQLDLACELSLSGGKRAQAQRLTLRPLGLDVDRVEGVLGVARGPHTTLRFGAVKNLTRADLALLRGPAGAAQNTLVRVYRRGGPGQAEQVRGALTLTASPLEPRVDLDLNATVQVREREVRALALYRFQVRQGSVFTLRARLPLDYALEGTLLTVDGRRVRHQLKVKPTSRGVELQVELERGLTRGQQALFGVEAVSERPRGLAGSELVLPRFEGSPATRFGGHLGLAPDGSFRLRGSELAGLTAIPARELQRSGGRGIEWADIVLGYRLEQASYSGKVAVEQKESRLSAELIAHHVVGEQTVATDAVLDLEVRGAPRRELVLLFPPGVGKLARIDGPGARPDRESLGVDDDGWERYRVGFERPVAGKLRLRVRFETRLATGERTVTQRIPKVSVEGAVRERGALAVFSAGATELKETAEGLRALDVTEVPAHPFRAQRGERPLLAYTHVSDDYALNLEVTRHTRAAVLTAVAERLSLTSSVGPDGTARHTARFQVKNLANQYFALQLPEDAVLWSVVVDGQGVKPAGEGGERIIPIPTAGTKGPNQVTEVVATYTSHGSAWGTFGASDLQAPQLRFGKSAGTVTDVVPVLQTTWALSLPDDYRVLEYAGNVDGKQVAGVRALALAGWRGAKDGPWPWLLALVLFGLGVAASTRMRRGMLVGLVGARAAARGVSDGLADARDGVVSAVASPNVRKGALVVIAGLLLVGLCAVVFNTLGGAKSMRPMAETASRYKGKAGAKTGRRPQAQVNEGFLDGAAEGGEAEPEESVDLLEKKPAMSLRRSAELKQKQKELRRREVLKKLRDAERQLGREQQKKRRPRRRGRRSKNEKADAKDRFDGLPEPSPADKAPPPAPKPMPKTEPPAASEPAPAKKPQAPAERDQGGADTPAQQPKGGFSFDEDDAEGRAGGGKRASGKANAGPRAGDGATSDAPAPVLDPQAPANRPRGDDSLGLVVAEGEATDALVVAQNKTKFGALGGFGQVGLRSLVLDLSAVGERSVLQRAGGHALVSVQFVKEAALVTVGGLLALLGFLAGLLLPRTGKLTAAGLLAVALVAVTAVPVLYPGAAVTALLNALALGLVLSAPALGVIAVARWWGTAPLSRLAKAVHEVAEERTREAGGSASTATTAVALLALGLVSFAAPQPAFADGEQPAETPLRVYVPYDPGEGGGQPRGKGTVFVPQEVFQELKRRAGQGPKATEPPLPAKSIVTGVDYQGAYDAAGLTLSATIKVDVLAKGWQRVGLGLAGTGLKSSKVSGAAGSREARVKVAPAGGFELVARGPASYTVDVELVVPRRSGAFTFATVPCLAAQMTIATADLGERRLVVDGAAAQLERPYQGKQTVFASLGDAARVSLLLRSRAVLSSGASEASARTLSLVAVRPGRLELVNQTEFAIAGAGREGFVFGLPAGFEVKQVAVIDPATRKPLPMRGWSAAKQKLEITLRRPTGARAVVLVSGEQAIPAQASTLTAPQLTAEGVSRETGQVGLTSSSWQKVRPGKTRGLRQIPPGVLGQMASQLKLGDVQWAYRFARRPAELTVDVVREAIELQASSKVTASVKKDRYLVSAEFLFQVRRGQLYEVRLAVPRGLELLRPLRGELKVSEVNHRDGPDGWRIYTLGLRSALSSSAELKVDFEQRLVPGDVARGVTLPFPEVRPLDVTREQASLGLAAGDNLELRVPSEPEGLVLRDVNEVTRGWSAPPKRARWQLGFTRPSKTALGKPAELAVKRPFPYVEGSWVLHARVERDVVRYTLRALYQISRAGVDTFQVLLPKGTRRQARVDAKNQREVQVTPEGDGLRYTVHLQSPVERFYGLSVSWEQLLGSERSFSIPAVNVAGVDRAVRGFVLVEKASEVADLLEQTKLDGVARKGKAGDAPALPPGKGAQDFVLTYQVPLAKGDAWGIDCQLKRRNVQHPPAARIPWAHVTSVFTRDGRVRHRVRYRVRNLRLQFLELALPEKSEVWSVFVANKPRRLHHKDGHALIPLPKRSAADLPFDVELIYTTRLSGSLGFGSLAVQAPTLKTPEIQVEKTFWTAYLPEDYEYRGFGGNVRQTTELEVQVTTLVEEVQEQARLEELARSGAGNQQRVADGNLQDQTRRVQKQIQVCESIDTSKLSSADKQKVQDLLGTLQKQNQVAKQLEAASTQRRKARAAEEQQKQQQARVGKVRRLGGNEFVQLDRRSWSRNQTFFKQHKERWANVGRGGGSGQVVLALPRGGRLSLRNMELLDRRSRRRLLNSSGYTSRQKEAKQASQATGKYWAARKKREEERPSAEGLLSIQVDFPTPGRAFHFVTDTAEAPSLEVSSYPTETASVAQRVAQALVLLALLGAILRLGLHLPVPGKGAQQGLLLILAVALAAFSLASLVGAALTFLLSLAGIHRGRLWPAPEAAASAAAGAAA